MKKIFTLVLAIGVLIMSFVGCNNSTAPSVTDDTQRTQKSNENEFSSEDLTTSIYSANAFFQVKSTDPPIEKLNISDIPAEKYEKYPSLHSIPLSATLYKNGEVVSVDIRDPRVVKLMNLYNNSVYYDQYAYTQGLLDVDDIEEVLTEDFRLELTFSHNKNASIDKYDTNIQAYDTFVITNEWFVLLGHDLPGYEGQEEKYPFRAVGHSPLFYDYCWLDLFGF